MFTRDQYIAALEKRASDEGPKDHTQEAEQERRSNMADSRDTLGKLFSGAGEVEKTEGRYIGKLFPGDEKKESGYPMMKVARQLFDDAVAKVPYFTLKLASVSYREVAFRSFLTELEKLGSWVGAGAPALHTALDAARKAPQTVGGTAQKFLGQQMKGMSAMPAPMKPMAQGSVVSKLPGR
jgi:hypothetical protein